MPQILHGVIQNVVYQPTLRQSAPLKRYPLDAFEVNNASSYGIVEAANGETMLGYAKWVSPKRTRSYPLARVYNIYHVGKRVAIIPIIKDEGLKGDNDRINFITLSWMNLSNVYIVLAYYENAQKRENKITRQQFDAEHVRQKLQEIAQYQQTAMHWNVMHFQRDFEPTYNRAVEAYVEIGQRLNVEMHSHEDHLRVLAQFRNEQHFSLEKFQTYSLPQSAAAAQREIQTTHEQENLVDGDKALFFIRNMLGGEYHLTVDEIFYDDAGSLVIQESKHTNVTQESKHTKAKLPSLADIQDGLFKLILFLNLAELTLNGQAVANFRVQLKLTGQNLRGGLTLPTDDATIAVFAQQNQLGRRAALLQQLNQETQRNPNLSIVIGGNA